LNDIICKIPLVNLSSTSQGREADLCGMCHVLCALNAIDLLAISSKLMRHGAYWGVPSGRGHG
jgi:hypothetical protein